MKLKLIGPPGCGKTSRLMELLEEEIVSGTRPDRIAFLTFTRAAREEALERTGKNEGDFPFLRTIHSICYRQLLTTQNQVVRPTDLRIFGREIGAKLSGNNLDPWIEEFERTHQAATRDDLLLQANHCGRHRGQLLKEALADASLEIDYKYAVWFTKAYRSWKRNLGMLDYTDLLTKYLDEGRPLPIDVIFVDEAQDLSSLQWEVVQKLGANAQRHYIAGDDDQAIFHWAGADSSAFQNLEVDATTVLGQSYRLSQNVHKCAQKISARIKKRLPKNYLPTNSTGEISHIGYLDSEFFNEKTFVLFRHHYRGIDIAQKMREEGIPFMGWGSPVQNLNVRIALLAWYQLFKKGEISQNSAKKLYKFLNPDYLNLHIVDNLVKMKTLTPKDIFFEVPEWFTWKKHMSSLPGIEHIEKCIRRVGFNRTVKPNTELLSIHQSKGREAHTVILDTEISRATYGAMMYNPDDEHRVWYVGVSRAKERVMTLMFEGHYAYKID